jgi:hypothetical protein
MVVLAIMTILTAIFLFQQQKFDSSTLLRTLGYSIALSLRQAQLYGSSVRQFDTTANGFQYSYGVYFNNSTTQYTLFADVNGDKIYSGSGENVQTFTLSSGYTITKVCGILSDGTSQSCIPANSGTGSGTNIGSLTIFFKRPDPDAQFSATNTLGVNNGETYCAAYIQVQGPGSDWRTVKVTTTGQITIGAPNTAVTGC